MNAHWVIIGAGMATAYLLQELAACRNKLRITVIGDEPELCYNRVMLSMVLAGEGSERDLDMLRDSTCAANVNFMASTRVESVDLAEQSLVTNRAERLHWDKLVFATGATVARPPQIDDGLAGVTELRTLDDTRRLRSHPARGGRALVVGGGLLGLEAAHGLNVLGYDTTVLHRSTHLMNRQLDEEGGRLLQCKLEAQGIGFELGKELRGLFSEQGKVTGCQTGDGECLPCDLLVLATGITPNASLARTAGLAVERGVLIDEHMGTSAENVYALGECSQLGQRCFGLVAPIRAQAGVLARRLLGEPGAGFVFEDWPTQLKISGIEIFSAGQPTAPGDEIVLRDDAAGVYRRLVLREGRLISAVLVGDKREGGWYGELISKAPDISDIRSSLMFGRKASKAIQAATQAA